MFRTALVLATVAFVAVPGRPAIRQSSAASQSAAALIPPDNATAARHAAAIVKGFGDLQLFSGAALIARGDQVLYRGAAGLAHPEHGISNSPTTPFRIASLTQLFTAAAIFRLADQGKLTLSDPVGKHLPQWPETHQGITITHLLAGNPGLKDVTQLPDFVKTIAVPRARAELVDLIAKEAPVSAPGGPVRATNTSYHLLAGLIETISGVKYHQFLEREFLGPLKLTSTRHDDPTAIIPGRAAGLVRRGTTYAQASWFHMDNALGMANLSSTVDDVFVFTRALFKGRLVSPAHVTLMTSPGAVITTATPTPAPGAPPPAIPRVGLGVTVAFRPALAWTSGGFINGFSTFFQYLPESDTTIIVLSNVSGSAGAGAVSRGLQAMLGGAAPYVPVARTGGPGRPADVAAIVGTWDVLGSLVITPTGSAPLQIAVRTTNGRLLVSVGGGAEVEWLSDAERRFYNPNGDSQLVLLPDKSDEAQYVVFGGIQTLKRIK